MARKVLPGKNIVRLFLVFVSRRKPRRKHVKRCVDVRAEIDNYAKDGGPGAVCP